MFNARFLASSSRAAIPAMVDISVWTRPCSARTSGTIPGGIGKNTSGKPTINPRVSVASRKAGKFPGKLRGRKAPNAGIDSEVIPAFFLTKKILTRILGVAILYGRG